MKKIVLIIVAASLMTMSSYSQEDVLRPKGRVDDSSPTNSGKRPWAIGLEGGLSYNKYGADLNWRDGITGESTTANSVYNVFESLSGLSPHIGFFVDYDIDKTFGFHVKFLYNQFRYSNNSDGIVDFFDASSTVYLGTEIVNLEVEDKFSFFSFDPSLRINANEQLYFLVGPSFNYGIGTRTGQFDFTKEDTDINFVGPNATSDNSSSVSASQDFKSTRYGINLGVGYKFEIAKNIYLAPQLNYNMDITSYNDQEIFNDNQSFTEGPKVLTVSNETINQLRFSITLWFENL
jgi:hypothetical protein